MKIYGVTGTNGKTTTTWVLAELLRAAGLKCGYVTTVEVDDGSTKSYTGYTTPPLPKLKEIFTQMETNGLDACTMEVSSHAIHQHRTGDTIFAGGAFTNLSEDHLDYHKTMAAYFEVKADFFRRLAAAMPGAPAVICQDGPDGWGVRMLETLAHENLTLLPCGLRVMAGDAEAQAIAAACPLKGKFNQSNVLTAAKLARAVGIPHTTILAAVKQLKARWGRLEKVETESAADVYVDFAHTDDALANVLSTAREFTRGKIWAVFGAGGNRDRLKRPKMGAAAARFADRLVVTSDNPRHENPQAIIDEILTGISAGCAVKVDPDRAAAIRYALANAQAGDSVLICGKGHENTQTIGDEKIPFDDREEARKFRRNEVK